MSTTTTKVAEDPTHSEDGRQLARIQYIEPEVSVDPWDCNYFAIPKAKETIHSIQPLNDLRPEVFSSNNLYKLATHAFTAVKHQSKLDIAGGEGHDREKAAATLIPEIQDIIKSATGAKTVHVLGLGLRMKEPDPDTITLRERDPNAPPERCGIDLKATEMDLTKPYMGGYTGKDKIGPARSVHIDYSPDGARQILRNVRGDVIESAKDIIEAEDAAAAAGKDIAQYDGRRYGMFSVWRPLKKVTRDPVAVCDPNSIDFERDLAEHINKQPSDGGDYLAGLSMLRGNYADTQKWHWISEQDVDEVFIFQFYDSYALREGRPWGAPHGGVTLVGKEDGEVRNSVEARCVAIW
ncbi:uncharacterized protein LY89DRAFT_777884 [Mollisia scopiformis]|uniref:GA4 desaturase n=1 Tax=Mollisia scopiformis TaxID=149040 RepID=A0A194XRE6_MOLSC|nr:uncharacterized protein LY89DRAFT_777884 [Mollisia scopiformis]KUJ22860.1 hypothetical protein LY89DRAFT_777884 [Mollisia scopiformis]